MPIKKSAFKAIRQSKKREIYNKGIKTNISWLKRQFLKAIGKKDKKIAGDFCLKLQKSFDKAAQKGVIKKNTASRSKSRLFKILHSLK